MPASLLATPRTIDLNSSNLPDTLRPESDRWIGPIRGLAMANLTINGKTFTLDVEPDTPLLWAIRENAGLTGTK